MRRFLGVGTMRGVLAFCGLLATGTTGFGEYEWHSYGDKNYALTEDYGTWLECEAEAQAVGGHLVTINDPAENDFLASAFPAATTWKYRDDPEQHVPAHLAWIGLYREGKGEPWKWGDAEPMTWDPPPWWIGQESDGDHAYLHVENHPNSGTWWNASSHNTQPEHYPRGIIETPEPSTFLLLSAGALTLVAYAWRRRRCR